MICEDPCSLVVFFVGSPFSRDFLSLRFERWTPGCVYTSRGGGRGDSEGEGWWEAPNPEEKK